MCTDTRFLVPVVVVPLLVHRPDPDDIDARQWLPSGLMCASVPEVEATHVGRTAPTPESPSAKRRPHEAFDELTCPPSCALTTCPVLRTFFHGKVRKNQ